VPAVDAAAIILPTTISISNPNNVPQPSESINVSSSDIDASATVQVEESLCIPPFDLFADGILTLFGIVPQITENIADVANTIGQILSTIEASDFLSDTVSVTAGVAGVITGLTPQPETFNYYVPVDIPITYSIELVGQTTYSGSLSYSVGFSS